jgi:hypothetical protein
MSDPRMNRDYEGPFGNQTYDFDDAYVQGGCGNPEFSQEEIDYILDR